MRAALTSVLSREQVGEPERLHVPRVICQSVGFVKGAPGIPRWPVARLPRSFDPERPICVAVRIRGFELAIGLGADPTFLMIQVEPFDGEYYESVGESRLEGCEDAGRRATLCSPASR